MAAPPSEPAYLAEFLPENRSVRGKFGAALLAQRMRKLKLMSQTKVALRLA
jgi:hypothetical protein